MKSFFKGRKGFSLIELIVSIAILAIIAAAACSFIFSGAGAYNSVYSNVSLQTSSQMVMNQIREYIIDCNGGVAFDDNTLYIIKDNGIGDSGDRTFDEYCFAFSGTEINFSTYTIDKDRNKTARVGDSGLLSDRVSALSAVTGSAPAGSTATAWKTASVTLTVTLTYNGRSSTTSEVIALRNNPYTAATEQALIAAVCG